MPGYPPDSSVGAVTESTLVHRCVDNSIILTKEDNGNKSYNTSRGNCCFATFLSVGAAIVFDLHSQ